MSRLRHFAAIVVALFTLTAASSVHAAPASDGHSFALSPDLTELLTLGEHGRTYRMMLIIIQIAALLAAAKLLGWAAERVKVPGVIGELLAGVVIGPFLLGSLLKIPVHGMW